MTARVNTYVAGALVRNRAAFAGRDLTDYELGVFGQQGTLPAGVGQDPPSVACDVLRPDGSTVTVPTYRDAAGVYHSDVDTTGYKGPWTVRFYSPEGGSLQGAGENRFLTQSAFL